MSIRLSLLAGVSAALISSHAMASDEQFSGARQRAAPDVNEQEMTNLYVKFMDLGNQFATLDQNIHTGRDTTLHALELSEYAHRMKDELNTLNSIAGSKDHALLIHFERQFLNMIPPLASLLKLEVMGDDKAYKLKLLEVVLRKMKAFVAK